MCTATTDFITQDILSLPHVTEGFALDGIRDLSLRSWLRYQYEGMTEEPR